MQKTRVCVLTGDRYFFGQTRKPWVSMDVERLCSELENNDFAPSVHHYHEIINGQVHIRNSLVLYSFSQRPNVRNYIRDLVRFLDDGSNLLVPSYELLLCHENKGYQELFKKRHHIPSLPAIYLTHPDQLAEYDFAFPAILKSPSGSNGKQVFLVKDKDEFYKVWQKHFHHVDFATRFDLWRRQNLRSKKSYEHYPNYSNATDYEQYKNYIVAEENFVLQQFVPNLQYDYRVLVLHDKYFVIRRMVRENDFRASGAKLYFKEFTPHDSLMAFARDIYEKAQSPYLSMDISESDAGYSLLEFQAIHFGINPVVKNKGYYQQVDGKWQLIADIPPIEKLLADGFAGYVRERTNWLQ